MQDSAGIPGPSAAPPAGNRLLTTAFILVISANLANAIGAQMANALLPVYVVSLGRSEFQAGLIAGMLASTALVLRPFVGWLVDAWRRRPMVLIGTGCYTVANLMYMAFSSLPLMLISRVIHGCGLSNYTTAFIAIFARHRGVDNPGLFFTVQAIALMLSRTFSGRFANRRGRVFVIMPGLICMAVGLLLLPFAHSLLHLLLSAAFIGLGFGSS